MFFIFSTLLDISSAWLYGSAAAAALASFSFCILLSFSFALAVFNFWAFNIFFERSTPSAHFAFFSAFVVLVLLYSSLAPLRAARSFFILAMVSLPLLVRDSSETALTLCFTALWGLTLTW